MPRWQTTRVLRDEIWEVWGALSSQGLCQGGEVDLSWVPRRRGWCGGEGHRESAVLDCSRLLEGDQVG